MNFDLIRSFVVLAETCHYGGAARRLNLSQPALSKQIRRLEDLLGAQLFERSRQGTQLTALGTHLLGDLRPILALAETARDKALQAARGESGRLSLGFTVSSLDVMAMILARFCAAHPAIEIEFVDKSSHYQIARVQSGELDIGFVRLPAEGLSAIQVSRDRLVLVCPARSDLHDTDLDDPRLRSMPFVALRSEIAPGVDDIIQQLLKSHGVRPRLVHRVNETLSVLRLVAAGLGVALMHETALRGFADTAGEVTVNPIPDPGASWDVGLVWRSDDPNPVLQRFLDIARQTVPSQNAHVGFPLATGRSGSDRHSASEPS